MSIFPATDIVADVARAADPQKAQAAYARLSSMAATRGDATPAASFSVVNAPRSTRVEGAATSTMSISPPPRTETLSPAQKFEAFLMQSWLETLLPKEESGVFGGVGPGANVWRSMMAEQLGEKLASAGALGLQKLLDHRADVTARS